jgi:hypothetical protein
MSTLDDAFNRTNLSRAWRWIRSNPDATYKKYCSVAYSRYSLADLALLDDLLDRLKRGLYKPTHACKLLFPKKSGILRPYTILTVEDQIVYQALVNVVADRLAPRMRSGYLTVTFGHMYAGTSSVWFYKRWRDGYRSFNMAARDAFSKGLRFSASFDLTACYDSLDYNVLCHFIQQLRCDKEFCDSLKEYLSFWTATRHRIYHSHGIPQGPLSSGLLAEVVLQHFDLNYGSHSNVRYLRYVDDIRLFAVREEDLRRMLVRLDQLSKDIGLFPQSNKIDIHEVQNIEDELKSISNPGEVALKSRVVNQDKLRKRLKELSPFSRVTNDTRFKLLLAYAEPSSKLNLRALKIAASRPDLQPFVMRYLRKYNRLPKTVFKELVEKLKRPSLYENNTAEMVETLDGRINVNQAKAVTKILKRMWKPRSLQPDLTAAVGMPLMRDGILGETSIRYALRNSQEWWVQAKLFEVLNAGSLGRTFLTTILNEGIRNSVDDVALTAALQLAVLQLPVGKPLRNINFAAGRALRQLRMISRAPRTVDGVDQSLARITGKPTRVNWRAVFGRDYKAAERQAVFCRALAETNVTAFVHAMDVFHDLLLSRLYAHDSTLGNFVLGNIGSVLNSARLRSRFPHFLILISAVHQKRYISSLAHPRARTTGKPTERIKYTFLYTAKRLMADAFVELAANW